MHVPVLIDEVLEWLEPAVGDTMVDGTLGGGGHTARLLEAVGPTGRVVAADLDAAALGKAEERFRGQSLSIVHANFAELPKILADEGLAPVGGAVLDLGLSSDQLADDERGFSFDADGDLDLRFNTDEGEPAWRLLERWSERHIADVIYEFGEERLSRRIARRIVEARKTEPVRTAPQLARLARACYPRRGPQRIDPATRTFQALRIAVNRELDSLDQALKTYPAVMSLGARIAIISFHSLEDRAVKQAFRDDPRWNPLTSKPIRPSADEVDRNSRSRSAKLRVAERTKEG